MQSERQLNERPNYNRIIFLGFNQQMRLRIETSVRYIRRAHNAHIYQHHTHICAHSIPMKVRRNWCFICCLSATFRNPVSKFTFQTTHGKPADSLCKNNAFRSSSEGQRILKKVLFGASFRILSNLYHIGLVLRVKNASCWWLLFSSCGYMATSTKTRID